MLKSVEHEKSFITSADRSLRAAKILPCRLCRVAVYMVLSASVFEVVMLKRKFSLKIIRP